MNQTLTAGPRSRSSFILHPSSLFRSAFTLTEILIVIGLIVLILILAVPALSFITGSRSLEGAQNQISAMLGRARAEAIGLQEPVGVAFFTDPKNQRLTMALVQFTPDGSDAAATIDFVPDRDQQVLPPGVGMQLVHDNQLDPTDPYFGAGVILFDGFGRLVHQEIALGTNLTVQVDTNFGEFPAAPTYSGFGFVLYDLEAFKNQADTAKIGWLNENALPVLVNRYNGTLVRGE